MLITMPEANKIFFHLATCEDAEPLADGGYTVDLYDLDPPVTLELYPAKGGLDVAAAFTLAYDEAQDGYYLDEKLESPEQVIAHIGSWLREVSA